MDRQAHMTNWPSGVPGGGVAGRQEPLRAQVAAKREPRFGFAQDGGTWYLDRIDELLAIVE